MRFLRKVRGSWVANVLQVVALFLGVLAVFHFLGFWWAVVAVAVVLILVSLAIDGDDK